MSTESRKLTRTRVGEIGKMLEQLPETVPPNRELTKKEAIGILAPIINKLLEAGYTTDQIAETLKDAGMPLSTTSLRAYLTEHEKALARERPPARKRGPRKRTRPSREDAQPSAPGAGAFEIRDRGKEL